MDSKFEKGVLFAYPEKEVTAARKAEIKQTEGEALPRARLHPPGYRQHPPEQYPDCSGGRTGRVRIPRRLRIRLIPPPGRNQSRSPCCSTRGKRARPASRLLSNKSHHGRAVASTVDALVRPL